jgi:hypothetical protein
VAQRRLLDAVGRLADHTSLLAAGGDDAHLFALQADGYCCAPKPNTRARSCRRAEVTSDRSSARSPFR